MVQIEILSGPDTGKILDLGRGTHTFGRAKTNDQVLALDSVSGRHLEIEVEDDGKVGFKDLGSTNGTWAGGVQVKEGEWFPGTELKLGSAALRLLDSSASAGAGSSDGAATDDDLDQDVHRRAREAALSGKKKGGPLQLVLVVVLLIAAGGGAWWTMGRGGEDPDRPANAGGGGGASVQLDAIDNYGAFEEAEVWSMGKGVELRDGAMFHSGARSEAKLNRNFPLMGGALQLSAEVSGLKVRPLLTWGKGEEETAIAAWEARDLSQGSATLPLPADAEWFQLSLILEGKGSLRDLKVETTDGTPDSISTPFGKGWSSGSNLLLQDASGILVTVHGQGGNWTAGSGGLDFNAGEGSELTFVPGDVVRDQGSFLILGEGGPVGLARGTRVDASPGLLMGSGATRLMLRTSAGADVTASGDAARLAASGDLRFLWDLGEVLTDAARLSQEINRAARDGDDSALLSATARLLRELPLDDSKVQEALLLSRDAIEQGRSELSSLQLRASGATFVGAASVMEGLAQEAAQLAQRFPGTDIASNASSLGELLAAAVQEVRNDEAQRASTYRTRVQEALAGTYPVLSNWIAKEGN